MAKINKSAWRKTVRFCNFLLEGGLTVAVGCRVGSQGLSVFAIQPPRPPFAMLLMGKRDNIDRGVDRCRLIPVTSNRSWIGACRARQLAQERASLEHARIAGSITRRTGGRRLPAWPGRERNERAGKCRTMQPDIR